MPADLPGGKDRGRPASGEPLRLHQHQADAIRAASTGANYVLTTGTGSGKTPRLHRPDRRPRPAQRRRATGDQGDRRLSDERAGQQPGGRAGEVPAATATRRASAPVTFAPLHRPGDRGAARRDPRQPAGHPAHQLRDARADPATRPVDGAARSGGARAARSSSSTSCTPTAAGRAPTSRCSSAACARRCQATEPAVRRDVGDAGRAGHVRRAAGRGRRASRRRLFGAPVEPSQRHRRDAAPRDRRTSISTTRRSLERLPSGSAAGHRPPTLRRAASPTRSRRGSSARFGVDVGRRRRALLAAASRDRCAARTAPPRCSPSTTGVDARDAAPKRCGTR